MVDVICHFLVCIHHHFLITHFLFFFLQVKREFHRDTFLKANPVFTNTLHYVYDPVPSDEVIP